MRPHHADSGEPAAAPGGAREASSSRSRTAGSPTSTVTRGHPGHGPRRPGRFRARARVGAWSEARDRRPPGAAQRPAGGRRGHRAALAALLAVHWTSPRSRVTTVPARRARGNRVPERRDASSRSAATPAVDRAHDPRASWRHRRPLATCAGPAPRARRVTWRPGRAPPRRRSPPGTAAVAVGPDRGRAPASRSRPTPPGSTPRGGGAAGIRGRAHAPRLRRGPRRGVRQRLAGARTRRSPPAAAASCARWRPRGRPRSRS